MKRQKFSALVLALCLTLLLAGCGSDTAVYVQSVSALAGMGGIAPGDKFLGLVVSEHVTEIKKDQDKTILELKVKEGDDVRKGQALFSYDTEEIQLSLDKQRLELEQLQTSIENFKSQITRLERERNAAGSALKLQYTVEIQTTQVDLKEAELKVKDKENEIKKSETLLANATVTSPIQGRIQAINENGTDRNGNELPYITIQQIGSYRIKGVLGELQRGSILEGARLKITTRTGSTQAWSGTVTLVDYANPSQGSENDRYFGMSSDEMTTASRYPFYVQPDSTDGLLLGQHVYLEPETGDGQPAALSISSAFLCYEEDGSAYVWAERHGKLEKRPVTPGQTNDMTGACEILEGLTEDDYIAFPDPELCREGAPTTHSQPVVEETAPPAAAEAGVA